MRMSLKTNTSRHQNRQLLYWAVGVVLILSAWALAGRTQHWWPFQESASKKQQTEATQLDHQKKEDTINNAGKDGGTSTAPGQGTYTPPTDSDNITLTATQSSSDKITVLTKLKGYSDGTCSLSIVNGSKTYTQSASVIYQPEFSTCAGFSVPTASLGSGTWNLTLNVVSGGVTTQKSTTLEVH